MSIRRKIAEWFYSPGAFGLWCAMNDDVEHWDQRATVTMPFTGVVPRKGITTATRYQLR